MLGIQWASSQFSLALRALANGIARNQYFVYRNSLTRPAAEKSRISERYKLLSPYRRCTRTSSVRYRSSHGFISFWTPIWPGQVGCLTLLACLVLYDSLSPPVGNFLDKPEEGSMDACKTGRWNYEFLAVLYLCCSLDPHAGSICLI